MVAEHKVKCPETTVVVVVSGWYWKLLKEKNTAPEEQPDFECLKPLQNRVSAGRQRPLRSSRNITSEAKTENLLLAVRVNVA